MNLEDLKKNYPNGEAYPDFLLHDMVMLLSDQDRFVTYFLLLAEKKSS